MASTAPPGSTRNWRLSASGSAVTGLPGSCSVRIDLSSRRVLGWKLDQRMDVALVIEALNRALGQRQVESVQLLVHTYQGIQYRAGDYRNLLRKKKISCSMEAKGCCCDNSMVESFFSTLKLELDLVTTSSSSSLPLHLPL